MIPPVIPSAFSATAAITPPTAPTAAGGAAETGFAGELQGALRQMENLQASASTQVRALVGGHSQDLHAGMIAVEKADLAFGMMLQLRNKAVQAYQSIANMPF